MCNVNGIQLLLEFMYDSLRRSLFLQVNDVCPFCRCCTWWLLMPWDQHKAEKWSFCSRSVTTSTVSFTAGEHLFCSLSVSCADTLLQKCKINLKEQWQIQYIIYHTIVLDSGTFNQYETAAGFLFMLWNMWVKWWFLLEYFISCG